jgi:adenosylhomocysteine nucleosidase
VLRRFVQRGVRLIALDRRHGQSKDIMMPQIPVLLSRYPINRWPSRLGLSGVGTIARLAIWAITCALAWPASACAQRLDQTPRTVVMTAYAPEYDALAGAVTDARAFAVNGTGFLAGTLEGKPVLLMKSGVSVVNAAMTTQLVLDRFVVRRIVFSGIAGGVDPALDIGDVVVPAEWGQYLEASFARETPNGWKPPETIVGAPPNWHFIFPRGTRVTRADGSQPRMFTIPVDPALLALANTVVPGLTLSACVELSGHRQCLPRAPRVVVGGTGVTAGIFADNAEFRQYLATAWHARVLDMESASVIQVAYANEVPAIVFRSLSDLAGGDADANRMVTFEQLAASNSARVVRAFLAALPD